MNNNPSINPANNNSLAGTLQFAFSKMMQKVDGMLPAKVIKYDRDTNRAEVQLLIAMVGTDGTEINRPQIASVPVMLLGGGDFFLSFPLKTNDLGWLYASDRDISIFLQRYASSPPNTGRVKNFGDGVFIPDIMRNYTIDVGDSDKAVLQNTDGSVKITLSDTSVNIEATADVTVSATNVNINADSMSVNLGALPYPANTLEVLGNIHASGTVIGSNTPP